MKFMFKNNGWGNRRFLMYLALVAYISMITWILTYIEPKDILIYVSLVTQVGIPLLAIIAAYFGGSSAEAINKSKQEASFIEQPSSPENVDES